MEQSLWAWTGQILQALKIPPLLSYIASRGCDRGSQPTPSPISKFPELNSSDYYKLSNCQPKFIHDQFITRRLHFLLV